MFSAESNQIQTDSSRHASPSNLRVIRFVYRQVSNQLLAEIRHLIELGEPIAILGPLASGKQNVLTSIAEFERKYGAVVVSIRCEKYHDEPESFSMDIAKELCNKFSELEQESTPNSQEWDLQIETSIRNFPVRITLLISNIDALPTTIVRSILRTLRRLKHLGDNPPGTLSVVFTGSYDLAPLVYGVESEFTIPHQYVLQGFGREWFRNFVDNYARISGFATGAGFREEIFKLTGGDVLQARFIIEKLIDLRRANPDSNLEERVLSTKSLHETLESIDYRLAVFGAVFHRPFARIASTQRGLLLLESLLRDGEVGIDSEQPDTFFGVHRLHVPDELELCGIARRDHENLRLTWASPLIRTLATQYFTKWNIADCFACLGDWDGASQRYETAFMSQTPLSLSGNHRPHLANAISNFAIELTRRANESNQTADQLSSFFARTFCALVGVESLAIWQWQKIEKRWVRKVASSPFDAPNEDIQQKRTVAALRFPEKSQTGCCELQGSDHLLGMSYLVQGEPIECIVADNFTTDTAITRQQIESFKMLCRQFAVAYQQRSEAERQLQQAEIDRRLLGALPGLLQVISKRNARSEAALRATANNLRAHDLRRVMISLIDNVSNEIQGVVDSHSEGETDVANMTKYSLSVVSQNGMLRYEDIQQKCVLEGQTIIVADASQEPLANQEVVKAAGLVAFVLVPIVYGNRVIGTIHLERIDRQLPTREFIAAIEGFCENLGKILYATSWSDNLERVAESEPDQVMLLDTDLQLQFANRSAAEAMQVDQGWQALPQKILGKLPTETAELIGRVREKAASEKRFFPSQAIIQEVTPIKDWRDRLTGISVRTQDVRNQVDLMEAFHEFSQCRSVLELSQSILQRLKDCDFSWARVFQAVNSQQMLGIAQYGLAEGSEGALAFAERRVLLERSRQHPAIWKSLEEKQTRVYSHNVDLGWDLSYFSDTGLSITNVPDPGFPPYLAKRDGDRWIDIPLFCNRRHNPFLGKLTVNCAPSMTRQKLLDLEILIVAASEAWAAILDREDREIELQAQRRQQTLRAMGETMHQLQSRISSLGTYIEANKDASSGELILGLKTRLHAVDETILDVKKKLKPLRPDLERVDLPELFCSELGRLLEPSQFAFEVGEMPAIGDLDSKLFAEVIDELVLNSRKAKEGGASELVISVRFSTFDRLGGPWCRIEYRDNGPGIPPSKLEEIFKEFYTSWPNPNEEGSGMGLPHIRSILEVHHGQAFALPCDQGACFVLELPSDLRFKYPTDIDSQAVGANI